MVDPVQAPPLVVLSFMKRLVAMNAHTGQRVWEFETGWPADGRLFVDQGLVIYAFGNDVLCLDYVTGAPRWKVKIPVLTPLFLVHGGCIVGTGLGEAMCLNAHTGALLWHDKFQGYGSASGPMAAPGVSAQIDHR